MGHREWAVCGETAEEQDARHVRSPGSPHPVAWLVTCGRHAHAAVPRRLEARRLRAAGAAAGGRLGLQPQQGNKLLPQPRPASICLAAAARPAGAGAHPPTCSAHLRNSRL